MLQPSLTENHCPGCLNLGLSSNLRETTETQLDLHLSVQFGEHWEPLLGGRVKLALTGGQLLLHLAAGRLLSAASEIREQSGEVIGQCCQAHAIADSAWTFEQGNGYLTSTIDGFPLATLAIDNTAFNVEVTFTVSPERLHILDAEGLWKHDLSPNKHAVLERRLVLFLLQEKLGTHLSRVQMQPAEPGNHSVSTTQTSTAIAPQALQALQTLIQEISAAKTDNFLVLAEQAGLNTATDLAGGNLLSVDCSGLDLSGANLSRANLRGALLCDADLSETTFLDAKLNGADVSGAYLGNANLSGANLQRASLALANLSGADLRGANLCETNLSNTKLGFAKVRGAYFKDNLGLSEAMRTTLKQRGARFEP